MQVRGVCLVAFARCPSSFVSSARSYNVFAGLQGFSAFTVDALLGGRIVCKTPFVSMHGRCGVGLNLD